MQDLAGWLLMLFSFSIVLMWKHVRSDTKVVCAIWFCMVLHHAVAYLNVYNPDGSSFLNVYIPDASGFHGDGAHFAGLSEPEWKFRIGGVVSGSTIYIQSLGYCYRAFGSSHFFGKELSVLAFVLSCVVLVKLVDLLALRRFRVGIILLFGLLPSAVIFMSVTLRESWQALFFLLSVYWAIRLWKQPGILNVSFLLISALCLALTHHGLSRFAVYLLVISVYWAIRLWKRPGILILLFMLMCALCMAFLHQGLARYAIYLIVISLYWGIFSRKMSVRWSRSVRLLFAGLLIACVIVLAQKMGLLMTVGQAVDAAAHTRQILLVYDVRTNFSFALDTSSVLGIVTTVPMVFVEYMFAPFPWQVENVKDLWALLESILRFLLLFFAISSWRRSSGEVRSYYNFLLLVTLGMEFVWALGTINWGTATRHHVPGYSVIVLLGAPGLILFTRELHFKIFGCRKDNTMLLK